MNRFMVTGRTKKGKLVTGWYVGPAAEINKHEIINYMDGFSNAVEPGTIEPFALPIVPDPVYDRGEGGTIVGYDALYPDCDEIMDVDEKDEFCRYCGQRLKWPEGV